MTTLSVHRLTTSVQERPGGRTDTRRVDRMLRAVVDRDLDARLHRLDLPPGEWCVRRVQTALPYDPDTHEATTRERWADALVDALALALSGAADLSAEAATRGSATAAAGSHEVEVVHYHCDRDALVDLVVSLSLGRTERVWAWRQLGLVADSEPGASATLVGALARRPELVAAVLRRALSGGRHDATVVARALQRLLGRDDWVRLAALVAGQAGAHPAVSQSLGRTDPIEPGVGGGAPAAPTTQQHAHELLTRSVVGVTLSRSGARPDVRTARAWAVLVTADVEPADLRRIDAAHRVEELARLLVADAGPRPLGLQVRTSEPPRGEPPVGAVQPTPVVADTALDGPPDAGDAEDQADDDPVAAEHVASSTVWGGLLFLLHTAADAGLPDGLDADPVLGGRSTRWVLHQLAQRLVPLAADDPAALALAGLAPTAPVPTGRPLDLDEDLALLRLADEWRTATLARLPEPAGDEEPEERMVALARRRADITAEPGWIDVALELDEVDTAVRLAGLDLDPGWVGWLGVVVRFRYV